MDIKDSLIAKTIDNINKVMFDYVERRTELRQDVENITNYLYNNVDKKMDLDTVERAMFIMKELDYIKFNTSQDGIIETVSPTNKGLLLLINGGLNSELERQSAEKKHKDFMEKFASETNYQIAKLTLWLLLAAWGTLIVACLTLYYQFFY